MLIKDFPLGQIETNCYIVTDENTLACVVIDPGDEANVVLHYLETNHLKLRYIFLTHGHFDHTMAVAAVAEETGAEVYIHAKDLCAPGERSMYKFMAPEGVQVHTYKEGDSFQVDGLTFQILETPGHSPGSVSILCGDALFSGDTLFRDSCGRTDLPGGDMGVLLQSLKRLYQLPGDLEVYPGHERASTMDRERKFNYYMQYAIEH